MTFVQVISQWVKSGLSTWKKMDSIEKTVITVALASILISSSLLITVALWR